MGCNISPRIFVFLSFFLVNLFLSNPCLGNCFFLQESTLPVLKIKSLLINESIHEAKIAFKLSKPAIEDVSFLVTTVDADAKAGRDFIPMNKQLVEIKANEQMALVTVNIIDDKEVEPERHFFLKIEDVKGVKFTKSLVEITLVDDDVEVIQDKDLFKVENRYSQESSSLVFVYPNPASEILTIETGDLMLDKGTIDIINVDGEVVQTIFYDNNRKIRTKIDVSALLEGIYLIRFSSEKRLLKQEKFTIFRP